MKSDHSFKNIKALVIDLEGALLNSMKDISPAASRILRDMHDKGVMIILCSSQNPMVISRQLKYWQLDDCIPYIAGRWGSCLLNRYTGKLTSMAALPANSLENLQQLALANKIQPCIQQGRDLYVPESSFLSTVLALKRRKNIVREPWPANKPAGFLLLSGLPSSLRKFSSALEDENVRLHSAGRFCSIITPAAASFDQTVMSILNRHQLLPEEALTIAMRPEFAPLFEKTAGAAMKNADPALLSCAQWTTKYPAAQDGAAYFINSALISGEFSFGNPSCLVHLPQSAETKPEPEQQQPEQAAAGESK